MKRIGILLVPAALALAGCLPSPWVREDQKPPPVQMKPQPVPTVTADGVDEANALEKARILREEMEHDLGKMQAPAARESE
ncbi:MAG: hypothetical protein U0736_20390 [Gemmataceae bacterium]